MIRYDRLWDTMASRKITQYRLIKQYNFSAGQIGRLKKNMHVSTHTLDSLCSILNCGISDIVEYVPEGNTAASADNSLPPFGEPPAANVDVPVSAEPLPVGKEAPGASDEGKDAPSSPKKRKKDSTSKADKPKKAEKAKKAEKKASKGEKPSKGEKKNKESKKNR